MVTAAQGTQLGERGDTAPELAILCQQTLGVLDELHRVLEPVAYAAQRQGGTVLAHAHGNIGPYVGVERREVYATDLAQREQRYRAADIHPQHVGGDCTGGIQPLGEAHHTVVAGVGVGHNGYVTAGTHGGGENVVNPATGISIDFINHDTGRRILALNSHHNI